VQRDQQSDARNQDNKRDKKVAVRENGFRSLGKSQWNLQGQISLRFTERRSKILFSDVRGPHAIFG
jgi:hypothetical protein